MQDGVALGFRNNQQRVYTVLACFCHPPRNDYSFRGCNNDLAFLYYILFLESLGFEWV